MARKATLPKTTKQLNILLANAHNNGYRDGYQTATEQLKSKYETRPSGFSEQDKRILEAMDHLARSHGQMMDSMARVLFNRKGM